MVSDQFHEPLGVVGQIIPWDFPLLMAVWKLAPALAAGDAIVLKPADQTPVSILVLNELIGDVLPTGGLNVVNGFGIEAGKPLASSNRIRKIAFMGETSTGRRNMQYASSNIIPSTMKLGRKSPNNIFFGDVAQEKDAFYDKALEGFVLFAFNQGEVCTAPSRAVLQKPIYDDSLSDAVEFTLLHRSLPSPALWTGTATDVRASSLGGMTTPLRVEDAAPVTTTEQARDRVADLVGHAISRQLWFMLLDACGRQIPLLIPVDDIPLRPKPGGAAVMAAAVGRLLSEHGPCGSVILTLERPGTAALTAPDQAWARELAESFGKVVRITGMFVAHDEGVCELPATVVDAVAD